MTTIKSKYDSRPLSNLVLDVLPFVTSNEDGDLPEPVIERALRTAAQRFMQESQYVSYVFNIDLQCGVDEYPLEMADSYYVMSVYKVFVNGREYHKGSDAQREFGGNRHRQLFSVRDRNWISIAPEPHHDCDEGLQVYATIRSDRDSCSIPYDLYNEFGSAIVDGALGELLTIKSQKEWYNPQEAARRMTEFKTAINKARVKAIKNHTASDNDGLKRGGNRHISREMR